jgi:hypothetical protein
MLALTAEEGDVAVRTDQNKTYILTATPSSTLANWQELLTPTDTVTSVDGRIGTVTLTDKYAQLATANTFTGGVQQITTASAATVGLIIKGVSGQTSSLQEWQDNTGAVVSRVSPNGNFNIGSTLAPKTVLQVTQSASAPSVPVLGTASGGLYIANLGGAYGLLFGLLGTGNAWIQNQRTDAVATAYSITFQPSGGNIGIGPVSGTPSAKLQVHSDAATTVVAIVRGAASQSANLQEWQNSAGTVLAKVTSAGIVHAISATIQQYIQDSNATTPYLEFGSNKLILFTRAASYVGFIIRGSASQSANLQEWQDSAGTLLANVTSGGFVNGSGYRQIGGNSNGFGSGTIASVLTAFGGGGNAAVIPVAVRGAASQTANLTEWQNSAGSILAQITSAGDLVGNSLFAVRTRYILSVANTGAYLDSNSVGNSLVVFQRVTTAVNLIVRAVASQTANLQEWQNSAGTIVGSIDVNGGTFIAGFLSTAGLRDTSASGAFLNMQAAAGILINARTATNNALIVKGATSQTANLQEWQDSTGTVLSRITSVGYVYSPYMEVPITNSGLPGIVIKGASGQTVDLQRWQDSAGTVLSRVVSDGRVYINSSGFSAMLAVTPSATTMPGIVVKAIASQTANMQEFQNTVGTVLASIDANGGASLKSTTLTASSSSGSALTLVAAVGQTANLLETAGGARITSGGNYFSAPGITARYVADFTAGAANVIAVTVIGAVSQTANLQQWQNSAGTVLASVTPNGSVTAAYFGSSVASTSYIQPNLTSGAIGILTAGNANVGLMVRGNSAQTANLQEWQNSAGTVLTKVDASGNITAASIVKTGGTSSQYLMADGSVTTSGGGGGSAADSDQNILAIQVFG